MKTLSMSRAWFLATAICCLGVIPIQIILAIQNETGEFDTGIARAINTLCYFTIQTNIWIGIVSIFLYLNTSRDSQLFNVARLTGVVCIIVVAVVYWIMLAPEDDLHGLNVVTNYFVHAINPVMYVGGWILFGPRKRTSWKIVKQSLIFPIGWAVFALVRGAIVDYYPYPFMDVRDLGYTTALVNMGFVTLFFLALFAASHYIDSKLLSVSRTIRRQSS